MLMPVNKMCPITQGTKPCLGALCAWFNEEAGICGVLKKPGPGIFQVTPPTLEELKKTAAPPKKTGKTTAVPPS